MSHSQNANIFWCLLLYFSWFEEKKKGVTSGQQLLGQSTHLYDYVIDRTGDDIILGPIVQHCPRELVNKRCNMHKQVMVQQWWCQQPETGCLKKITVADSKNGKGSTCCSISKWWQFRNIDIMRILITIKTFWKKKFIFFIMI